MLALPSNLCDLYLWSAGKSSVPESYHRFTCLAMIAACVAGRVWMQRLAHAKIYPNIYTFLLGDSGVGKGVAISYGLRLIPDNTNIYHGKLTAQAIVDLMTAKPRPGVDPTRLLIVAPELASDMVTGRQSDELVKFLTEHYDVFGHMMTEATRAHGLKRYRAPVLNFLAGSTLEWLPEAVSVAAIQSGFFARCLVTVERFNPDKVMLEPLYPDGYERGLDELKWRFSDLSQITGEMRMSTEAEEFERYWFENRRPPHKDLSAFWLREPATLLKLSMLFALADSLDMVIQAQHVGCAVEMLDKVRRAMLQVNRALIVTQDSRVMEAVMKRIRQAKDRPVRHGDLTRQLRQEGFPQKRIIEAIETLVDERTIVRERGSRHSARVYRWIGVRPIPPEVLEGL